MSEIDDNNNKYIADKLNIKNQLDFMNDSHAIHVAEEEIVNRGWQEDYLKSLNEMDSTMKDRGSLDDFKTKKPGFKAFAIVKLLRGKK